MEKDVAFKQKFYYAKGAHYETATLNSIELLPKEAVISALQEDYQAMKNMIYGNIPGFEDILEFLEKLQEEIHGLIQSDSLSNVLLQEEKENLFGNSEDLEMDAI